MTKTNKKANSQKKAVVLPSPKQGISFAEAVSWVSLVGATVQLFLSLKILIVDKEFATLALSFVFFLAFVVLYFFFSRKVIYGKKEIWIELSLITGVSLVLLFSLFFTGLSFQIVALLFVSTITLNGGFPLTNYWLTCLFNKRGVSQ
jgi:hypothetical protein